MTTKTLEFSDSGKLTIEYEGVGSGKAEVSAEKNEGLDRELSITFKDESSKVRVEKKVAQKGMRQAFMGADKEFRGSDDKIFAIYKEGMKT